jgi:hypothetical protein
MSQVNPNLTDYEIVIENSKIGYLVDSNVGFGVCGQFQLLMEGKASTNNKVFTEEEKATDRWQVGEYQLCFFRVPGRRSKRAINRRLLPGILPPANFSTFSFE